MKVRSSFALAALVFVCAGAQAGSVIQKRPIHRTPASTPRMESLAGPAGPRVTVTAFGGYTPYHNGATLLCADCHVMHASEQHAYDGGSEGFPRSNTPYDTLLRKAAPVDICLSCHDGRLGVPDVVGVDTNALAERSAGMFEPPETPSHRGHTIGRGLDLDADRFCSRCHFDGEFATAEVSCLDCHNHHGNDRVRNLQWASAKGSEPQFAMIMRPGATGLAKYERQNVAYGHVPGSASEVTNMCIDCHHTFFGDSGGWYTNPDGDDHWNRHPNFNSEWGAVDPISAGAGTGSIKPAHWMGGVGSGFGSTARVPFVAIGAGDFTAATTVDADRNAVFCLTCHKAHGSENAFAMTFDPQTVPKAKGCDQCHAVVEP